MHRRDFLAHSAGIGLGAVFLPHAEALLMNAHQEPFAPSNHVVLEPIRTDGLALISYLLGDKKSGKAVVIDPRRDVDVFVNLAQKHGLTITHALETHIHADFVSGSRELAARTGTAQVHASVEGGAQYGFPVQPLRHGDKIDLGHVVLSVLHTPGHTPEHISFLAVEKTDPDRPFALFTGDFLFVNSVGRPDLLGVEQTSELSQILFRTLQTAFAKLPDAIPIFPAHGAGSPCGSQIGDSDSTLGQERRSNPALQFKEEAAFIEWLLASQPPVPYYWPRMKKINAAGPEVLGGLPDVPAFSPKEFQKLIAANGSKGVQFVDNRHMLAFGGGHVAGALNIGPKADLSIWAGWMLDPERPIALVLAKDSDLPEVLAWFIRVGYTKFAGMLKGGMDAWVGDGLPIAMVPQLSVHDLKAALPSSDKQVVDVRQPVEWDMGHLPGAQYIFLPELEKKLDRLDRKKPVVVYCASGFRSSIAASLLQRHGFTVMNVPGSFKAWTAAGFPVEKPAQPGRGTDTERR
ncbi:MAG TPA: rhodanese-like domain-containing protein [Gemmatales bacterium]|nr:rhodanese-like domain-containing protein [Gemmatales bacterium]HMP61100.1 rhodanese-like domain-containing protein [Gemmatales bacterium]